MKAFAMYKGYHTNDQLPFKQGQNIVIPAGTPVRSTHPSRKSFTTARKQTVRINHFGCGRSLHIGRVHSDGTRYGCLMSRDDGRIFMALYGTDDPDVLVHHELAVVRGVDIFLAVDDPTVIWPGTGGYWCEVDINLLLESNGVAA